MKNPNSVFVLLLSLSCSILWTVQVGNAATSISQSISSKFGQVIDKLNALKKSDTAEMDTVIAAASHTAEAREPSSGYGGSGHGGGGYSSYGGGHGGGHGGGYGGGGHGGGGYGGGGKGYGGGGHGHGAITLDPVSIISLLALGAFLINNILQLLRANSMMTMMSGRSLDVSDINVPLDLSDIAAQTRELREESSEGPSFSQFFKNVGSLYYLAPKKRNLCIKKVVCDYVSAQKRDDSGQGSLRTKIFDIMLTTITTLVAPELHEETKSGAQCLRFNKLCSDSLLKDAKITAENKVYGHVTSIISKFALSSLMSG